MLLWLFLLLVILPFLDLWVLLRVGQILHFWPTVGLVVLIGFLGAALVKRQGLRTLTRIRADLAAGRMPTAELADGAFLLLAGALLVAPGFLTDVFGLLLLIPPVRSLLRRMLSRQFQGRFVVSTMHVRTVTSGDDPFVGGPGGPPLELGGREVKHVRNDALRDG